MAATPPAPDHADAVTKFLTSPGVMGAMIRAHDWAATPLGPIAQWPSSLKTAVSLMLSSRQPMWIGWGDAATFLYNDAYIDVLSLAKHPWALGRPAAEVWSEIWHICGPLADAVFARGEATMADDVRLFMNRGDMLEETYFSFSYSPIRDESGTVAGLFCPNLNVTATHLNARRLRALSELATRALTEKSVQAACASAIATMAEHPADLPFALVYLAEGDAGAGAQADGAPALRLAHATHPLLAGEAMADVFPLAPVLHDLSARAVDLPPSELLAAGPSGQPVRQALVLPLPGGSGQALGVLVAGASPALRLDAAYRSYFELVATQVATAIQNARASEDERTRAALLAEVDRAKTAFFSNVSHEFRTPLTLMLGPMEEALADTGGLDGARRERLQLVQRNALRLQKLVNTLLEFSRVQAGRAQADFVPTDLAALTAELAGSFRSTIEAGGVRLVVDCAPLPAAVYVDQSMWEKIILNLLSNAFKFTMAGEIRAAVGVEDGRAVVTVSDTGAGIAASEMPRLFERFHRIAGGVSRTHEGSGIGLALVHDLVSLHGGEIGASSTPGQGTRFRIVLPLGHAHLDPAHVRHDVQAAPAAPAARSYVAEAEGWIGAAPADQQEPELPEPPELAAATHERVLVVDDNADMRDYLRRLFARRWQVEVAHDGLAALEAVRRQAPDVIVSDVMMPRLDGPGLIAALRADANTRNLPVVLLSARAGEEARVEGLAAGADDYIVKPFSGRELMARVESLLLRRRVRAVEQAAAQRMQSIFAQAPVAIAILRGPQHVFEQANGYYHAMSGKQKLIGLPLRAAVPEIEGQGLLELLDGVLASGQPYVGRSVRVMVRRETGPAAGELAEAFFDFVYQPLFDADGQAEGVAVVAFEVTELAAAKRAAEAANLAKDEFLAMLGHELRNPLAPIVTALQLMRLRGVEAASREREIIERQTRHLVSLVDDLLDVARVAQGKIVLHKERVEIADVIARAIETASPLIEQKRHRLEVDVAAHGLAVLADPARLAQAVANVVSNAAKYTEAAGLIRIDARCEATDSGAAEIVVSVVDNGIGIAPATIGHIFDMFVQERQALSRSQGGLGLGLAIVRSMVELHGGSVSAASEGAGRGSRFVLRLPAAPVTAAASGQSAPADAATAVALAAPSGLSVLVVDDNRDAARVLGEMLAMQGHEVEIAFDGPSAIALARRFQPDVGLLDIGLPGMDGYELAQALRADAGRAPMRLFAITGYGQDSDRRRAAAAGFDRHLVKPVDLAQLEAALRG